MDGKGDPFRYWGKARKAGDGNGAPCHLLPFHCLDVAAVGQVILAENRPLTRRLAAGLSMEPETFAGFFVYSLALHDLGKFARSFQGLTAIEGCDLVPPDPRKRYERRHDALGAALWADHLLQRLDDRGHIDPDTEDALIDWMGCFFGHHGKPVRAGSTPLEFDFTEEDKEAACGFAAEAEGLLEPTWPHALLGDEDWRHQTLAPATWQLAGLGVLADWLGSNTEFFPYRSGPMALGRYWEESALPGARRAVATAGMLERPAATAYPGFTQSFGLAPTPLQAWAESVPLAEGPQLFLLEDITGAGKTEAALTLAHRLLAAGHGAGLYFGLPTMATSNAMYLRLGHHYRTLYPKQTHPSLVLAHGARHLNEAFTGSVVPEPNADRLYTPNETTAGAECRGWLADNRKKALLAEVGVGTIDQALLGVLPRKHQALRLLGLSDKVLVVDEVHAYEPYTRQLLQTLLADHARQGGSAILLSATIPHGLRRELVTAWYRGRQTASEEPRSGGFPLATHAFDTGLAEQPLAARPASRRELPVRLVHDPNEALEAVIAAARSGQCACWIRNTVDDAIEAYRLVRERLEDPDRALLFHARFTMADRQRIEEEALAAFGKGSTAGERAGRVLIATQVVEQSLDLDFDVLVSDLAPVELLIQRAGRLHRHIRSAAGDPLGEAYTADQRPAARFHVLTPEWAEEPAPDWVRRTLPGTAAVYSDPALLWLTCKVLREETSIHLPERARVLLEGVYGEDVQVPEGLRDAHDNQWADERVAVSNARFNALDLERGYPHNGGLAGWDDEEIGTRLSDERTVSVVLVRRTEKGLAPRHPDQPHPWAMSTLNLREGQARRLPGLPPDLEQESEALREAYPLLRHAQFWLPEEGGESPANYTPDLGAVIPRRASQGASP